MFASSDGLENALSAASAALTGESTSSTSQNPRLGSSPAVISDEWVVVEDKNPWIALLVADWRRLQELCQIADCETGWTEVRSFPPQPSV